jgi:CheY-like chemotaxis protein
VSALASISCAMLGHPKLDLALDDALAHRFLRGPFFAGALFLVGSDGRPRARIFGDLAASEDLPTFFGCEATLHAAIAATHVTELPSAHVQEAASTRVLGRLGAQAALLVPLVAGGRARGALLAALRDGPLDQEARRFAELAASQVALALALSSALAAKEVAETRVSKRVARLGAALEHTRDIVLYVDREGNVGFSNQTIPPPVNSAAFASALDAVFSSGELVTLSFEVAEACVDTTRFTGRLGPVLRDGEVVGALLVARDAGCAAPLGPRSASGDRLTGIAELLAKVVHEINTPLATLRIELEQLRKEVSEGLLAGTFSDNFVSAVWDAGEGADLPALSGRVHEAEVLATSHRHARAEPGARSPRGRVLVVDDDVATRRAIRRHLDAEHELVTVGDPRAVMGVIAARGPFDLILCDLLMPTLAGTDLYALVQEGAPEHAPRIVFMTGGAVAPRASPRGLDVVDVLEKPFSAATIRDFVAARVARARAPG